MTRCLNAELELELDGGPCEDDGQCEDGEDDGQCERMMVSV